jgi:hypothetical protein
MFTFLYPFPISSSLPLITPPQAGSVPPPALGFCKKIKRKKEKEKNDNFV